MTNPTDTNQASELYELCKEVYKLTKLGSKYPDWIKLDGMKLVYVRSNGKHETVDWSSDLVMGEKWGDWLVPLYTSDYLLEKLQSWFYDMGASDFGQFYVTILADACIAKVRSHDDDFSEQASADTPLKALLKLTIALSEAGEL